MFTIIGEILPSGEIYPMFPKEFESLKEIGQLLQESKEEKYDFELFRTDEEKKKIITECQFNTSLRRLNKKILIKVTGYIGAEPMSRVLWYVGQER